MKEDRIIKIGDLDIRLEKINDEDYFCISNFVKEEQASKTVINNWMRTKNTIEFLGLWEKNNNEFFKGIEFDTFKNEAGSNRFILSPKKWIENTNAIGIKSKAGRYNGGTFAHEDIALEFASWLSPEFKLYLIKEFKRLKKNEAEKQNELQDWHIFRDFTKMGYKIQTDAIQQNIIPYTNLPKNKEYIIYSSEADLLNVAVFGMKAGEFEKDNPDIVKKGKNIRDFASKKALNIINNLQSSNAKMIREGIVKEKRIEQLIIQANEEKISLNLIKQTDLFQNDLFNKLPMIKKGQENISSAPFIEKIQQDNLEIEDNNDFEFNLNKITKFNKS